MVKDSGKSFLYFIYIYIQIGKRCWQIVLKIYIYKLAKLIGKSSENQTDNYRQL